MLTLEKTEPVFETNANQTGVQRFEMVKRGTTQDDKNVYIYKRSYPNGQIFAYEVFLPKILKAGTVQKFPGGAERIVENDIEEYPNGAKTDFGKRAWFCSTLERAEARFNQLTQTCVTTHEETETETESENVPHNRGRSKNDRPVLTIPVAEFSTKELAEQNNVDYSVAFLFLKEKLAEGKIVRTREERRAAKGKPTQLFVAA